MSVSVMKENKNAYFQTDLHKTLKYGRDYLCTLNKKRKKNT